MNDAFQMTENSAIAEGPTLMAAPNCYFTVWVGADERKVVLDQAKWLSDAWNADLEIEAKKPLFDVTHRLEDAKNDMLARLLCD